MTNLLKIPVPEQEFWDGEIEKFITYPAITLVFEHSLATVHEWEQKTHKPFLKTLEGLDKSKNPLDELMSYFRIMCQNEPFPANFESYLDSSVMPLLMAYINDKATATTFYGLPKGNRHIITAEEIYYVMFKLGIPLECEHWHFNTLQTLITVFNVKDDPKKMPENEVAALYRKISRTRK